MRFPGGFLWGAATAAHQVEGGNINCDSWLLEHVEGSIYTESSGDACDHYHRYDEDIRLLAALGLNAYRFSLEWARIEPEEGEFSLAELDHYRRMLASCREHGVEPVVTLHHFTSPQWIAARGGWEEPETARLFSRYCEKVVDHLGDLIGVACTVNELNLAILLQQWGFLHQDDAILAAPWRAAAAHRLGVAPERFSSFPFCVRGASYRVLLDAHRRGAQALRAGPGNFPVGMTLALREWYVEPGGEALADDLRLKSEEIFLEAARSDDFLGVQCYTRQRVGPGGLLPPNGNVELTQMGYEIAPEALATTLRHASERAQVPLIVTENGIATDDDGQRIAFIEGALAGVASCLRDGIDVRGYFYWSLLDNFEWLFGYGPKFGLIAVDRKTLRRSVKPSAEWLGRTAQNNAI
jgi:beta-glucosidase